jgi:glycine cleavage system transcriptional repressor
MSKRYSVLTAVGPDRPGLVNEIAAAIHSAGANLEDSRMALLAGEFALVVLLSGSSETIERICRGVREMEQKMDLSIILKDTQKQEESKDQDIYLLEVTGVDQPGIVRRASEPMARRKVNIVSLESRLDNAAFSGTPLFSLKAELQMPDESMAQALRAELEGICEEWNLSYSLKRR